MGKLSKNGKNKVPKITEAEYAAYVAALKEDVKTANDGGRYALTEETAPKEQENNKL